MLSASPSIVRLYSADEARSLDRAAIERHGIPGIHLMKRAGAAAFDALRAQWPSARSLSVVCGAGNNAGDGWVVAGLARDRGFDVQLLQLGSAAPLRGDAALARDWAQAHGVSHEEWTDGSDGAQLRGEVVVDALLGTGAKGPPRPGYARAIERINTSGHGVLAVDLPSGVAADTGHTAGAAVAADVTVTFIGAKRGLYTGAGVDCAGSVVYADLGVPRAVFDAVPGVAALRWQAVRASLRERPRSAHKNRFGHVLVIGGDAGMGGAVAMTAEAALRVGAGLVSVATRPNHVAPLLARRPELMVRGLDDPTELDALLARASVIAVGPGIGRSPWAEALFQRAVDAAIGAGKPIVIDAEALTLLAQTPRRLPDQTVLTPHPGEAARLLGVSVADVQSDRFGAAQTLATRFGARVVVKGAGSVLAAPGQILGVCLDGNPGMATAGTGDVLTGVVAGLLAAGAGTDDALRLGVCLHAAAGDLAARDGMRGLLATDVLACLRRALDG